MKYPRCPLTQSMLPCLLLVACFSSCTPSQERQANQARAHAFIAYWPPPAGSSGLRLAVKDNIDMHGVITSAGSEYLAKNNAPAKRDAPCLALARERNVQIVGKTNLTEFAVTVSGANSHFGTPRNRWDGKHDYIPGGSSSGSAVAVATGMADVAFGTDTAGSIRVPAACCGIYGLKTTFGLVPIKGVFPISPSHLDTVGPMARDMKHLVQGMDLLQRGFAARYEQAVADKPSARQITIGRLYLDGTDPAIDKALDDALAAKRFKVIKLDRAFKAKWERAQKDGQTIATADAWFNDQEYGNKKGVNFITKAVFALGAVEYQTSYEGAIKRKAAWQRDLREVFRKVDFIAVPTLQSLPPRFPFFGSSVVFELLVFNMQNTTGVNYAGNPALAVPIPMPVPDKTVPTTNLRKPLQSVASLAQGALVTSGSTGRAVIESSLRHPAHSLVTVTHGAIGKPIPITSLQLVGPRLSEAELLNAGRLIGNNP